LTLTSGADSGGRRGAATRPGRMTGPVMDPIVEEMLMFGVRREKTERGEPCSSGGGASTSHTGALQLGHATERSNQRSMHLLWNLWEQLGMHRMVSPSSSSQMQIEHVTSTSAALASSSGMISSIFLAGTPIGSGARLGAMLTRKTPEGSSLSSPPKNSTRSISVSAATCSSAPKGGGERQGSRGGWGERGDSGLGLGTSRLTGLDLAGKRRVRARARSRRARSRRVRAIARMRRKPCSRAWSESS